MMYSRYGVLLYIFNKPRISNILAEKTIQEKNSEQKKERFQFVLTINGNLVCKRYFYINGFKNESEKSLQLAGHHFEKNGDGSYTYFEGTLEHCARLIHNDLVRKSNIYIYYTAPQIFDTEDEMNDWVKRKQFRLDPATNVVVRDTRNVYIWSGEKMEPYNINGEPVAPYDKVFNVSDYIGGIEDESKNVLKLAFYDNGVEICSTEWDANVYPKFVRTNIDISNSINRYKKDGQYNTFESTLIDLMIKDREDLIPVIIREFCECCSPEDKGEFTTSVKYGKKTYNLNYEKSNTKMYRAIEKSVQKKTDEYTTTLY